MALIMRNQQNKVKIKPEWEDYLIKVAEIGLEQESIPARAEISLLFVDDEEIRKLNKNYRSVNQATDVLSFPLLDSLDELTGEEILLGDIVISLETAVRQKEEYGHSLEREIAYLMTHGLLHLLGYDHLNDTDKSLMREKEEMILQKINLVR